MLQPITPPHSPSSPSSPGDKRRFDKERLQQYNEHLQSILFTNRQQRFLLDREGVFLNEYVKGATEVVTVLAERKGKMEEIGARLDEQIGGVNEQRKHNQASVEDMNEKVDRLEMANGAQVLNHSQQIRELSDKLVEKQFVYYQLKSDNDHQSMMVRHHQMVVQDLESQLHKQNTHIETRARLIAETKSLLENIEIEKNRLAASLASFDDPAQDEAAFYEYLKESEETERLLQTRLAEELAAHEKEQRHALANRLSNLGKNRESNSFQLQEKEKLKLELAALENSRVRFAPMLERSRDLLRKKEEELKGLLEEFYGIVEQSKSTKEVVARLTIEHNELKETEFNQSKNVDALQIELSAIEADSGKEIQARKETAEQLRKEVQKLQAELDGREGELEDEINQYFELIRIAEHKLKSPLLKKSIEQSELVTPFPSHSLSSISKPSPETPYTVPSAVIETPTPEASLLKNKRKSTPHPTKKTNKDNKQASSVVEEEGSTSTKKRKLRSNSSTIQIISINPHTQQVEVKNVGDTAQNLTGWKIHNPTYAFQQVFPKNLILQPQQIFTFAPQKADQKVPPAGFAFWDVGNRDIRWPIEGAKAYLKDNAGILRHSYPS